MLTVFFAMVVYAMNNWLDILVIKFCIDYFLLCALIPIKSYFNAEAEKAQILLDNQNKAGIYMWKNTLNEKCYIGSAENLSDRLSFYYSNLSMKSLLLRSKSHICSAILKDDRSNFSLEILEYCEPSNCLIREKHYLDLYKPEYNISQDPSAPMSGRKHSDKTKKQISDALTGEKNPMFRQPKPKGAGIGRPSQAIEVFDIKNNTTTSYNSIREAARTLNINKSVIDMYFRSNQQKPYKGLYTFKKIS